MSDYVKCIVSDTQTVSVVAIITIIIHMLFLSLFLSSLTFCFLLSFLLILWAHMLDTLFSFFFFFDTLFSLACDTQN